MGDVDDALAYEPEVALVGVATQGGQLPARLARAAAGLHRARALDRERPARDARATTPSFARSPIAHGVELRDLRRPPAGLDCPTGANLEVDASIVLTVGSDCAIGKMTVSLELDRAAQARGLASVFVPTGQTGIAIAGWGIAVDAVVSDFIAGAAEQLVVEGPAARGRAALGRGAGLARPSGVLRRDARPLPRLGPARARAVPQGGRDRDRGRRRGTRSRRWRSSSSSTSGCRFPAGRRASSRSPSTPPGSTPTPPRQAVDGGRAETGLPAADPVRDGPERAARRGACSDFMIR